jgi:6-phosphogluconolactonase
MTGRAAKVRAPQGLNAAVMKLARPARSRNSPICAFRIDSGDGRLSLINQKSTHGKNPVHLGVDPANRFVVIANHVTSGQYVSSLAVLTLCSDGALGELVDHVPLTGKIGPHRIEQPFAKPHQCQFDPAGRFIAVPDKGLDVDFTYYLDGAGKLHCIDGPPAPTREGEGPRHIAFHPRLPYAFVIMSFPRPSCHVAMTRIRVRSRLCR